MKTKIIATLGLTLALALSAAGCGGGDDEGGGSGSEATTATGPIKIWFSNNEEEIAWGKAMVSAWNAANPDQKITAQEIPAGKTSEEVIGAAITAGTAPCLVFNTSPAAVPQFQKQGGLVDLTASRTARPTSRTRTGDGAAAVQVDRRQLLPAALEVEPGDDLLQQGPVREGRARPGEPAALDLRRVPRDRAEDRRHEGRRSRDLPAPTSEFFQSWFDFYPLYAAETGGKQLVEDGKATFDSPEGKAVAEFWKSIYAEGLRQQGEVQGDSFADGKAAMSIVGPWAIAVYKDKSTGARSRSRPPSGTPAGGDLHLLRRQERRPVLGLRERRAPPGRS